MARLSSSVDPRSEEFAANARHHRALAQTLRTTLAEAALGGGERPRRLHHDRGRLLVEERLERLLDPGSPFLEIAPLAAHGLYDNQAPRAGLVAGIGRIAGRMAVVVANDPTVKGGAYFPLTVRKHLRAQEIAWENRLPCVYLVDSGGAFLPLQAEVFPDREHFGRIFYNQARLSAAGLAQIAVVLGPCTAGGAYVPAMCDEAVIVARQGTVYLGGPPLVKAATGEVVDAETLGGGDVHARTSGVVDHLAADEDEALALAREIFAHVPDPEAARAAPPFPPVPPRFPIEELYGVLPRDLRTPYDVHEILARLLDGSEFHAFKPLYGTTLVCGFGRLEGYPLGVLANQGILFSESALKGTHFIELCEQRGLPLLFLQNITGFMVGSRYEHGGIAKDGAKMVNAVATASVPKITVLVGGSFGAGNYAMCGRAYGGRFLWSWPNARISVMGGEQAAAVLTEIRAEALAKRGASWSRDEREAYAQSIRERYEREGDAYYASARLWDDGVLDPAETRRVLGLALGIVLRNVPEPAARGRYGVFRM
jgi:3-methylcrotonyl-CoA carboxylase beta subunit